MENEYVVIKDGLAFIIYIVRSDLAMGRFQVFSPSLNNVHHTVYESVAEVEKQFDDWIDQGKFDGWAKMWNQTMGMKL